VANVVPLQFNPAWNFCRDCASPAHRMEMARAGQCQPDWIRVQFQAKAVQAGEGKCAA